MTDDAKATPPMTLRDWFAGQALAGLCAAEPVEMPNYEWFADQAYTMADAMLARRAKETPNA